MQQFYHKINLKSADILDRLILKGILMHKKLATSIILSFVAATTLSASGYKIPEQSLNATALSAANVAAAHGADASYYNPANMVFNDDKSLLELHLMYIHLPSITFTHASDASKNGESKKEHFFIPTLHYVSPDQGDWRYGLSITAPAGLSKRWDTPEQKTSAEEFTLKTVEINPTLAYKVSENFSIGGGVRAVYAEGVVKSDGLVAPGNVAKRDLEGNTFDYGYNLALTYRTTDDLRLSATYRSHIELDIEGNAKLYKNSVLHHDTDTSVKIHIPAAASLALAYDVTPKTTAEFVAERTYWSVYENLDFEYSDTITDPVLKASFDDPKAKDWKDTNAYRLGVTHRYSDDLTLMVGYLKDKSPIPNHTLAYELPGSDTTSYSGGFLYKLNENKSIGFAYLYADKKDRDNSTKVSGNFTDNSVHLASIAYKMSF
jgi:long-chain fatty acid transport protein